MGRMSMIYMDREKVAGVVVEVFLGFYLSLLVFFFDF